MPGRGLGLHQPVLAVDGQTGRGEGSGALAAGEGHAVGQGLGARGGGIHWVDVEGGVIQGALVAGLNDGQDAFTGVGGDVGTGDVVVRTSVGILALLGHDLVVEAVAGNESAALRGTGQQVIAVALDRRIDSDGEGHRVADPQARVEPLVVGQAVGAIGLLSDRPGRSHLALDLDRRGDEPGGERRLVVDRPGGRGQRALVDDADGVDDVEGGTVARLGLDLLGEFQLALGGQAAVVVLLAVGVPLHGDGVDQAGGLAVGAQVAALEVGLGEARGVLSNGEGHLHREGSATTIGPGPGSGGEALAGTALDEGDRSVEGTGGVVPPGEGHTLGVNTLLQDPHLVQVGTDGHLRGVGEVGGHRAGDQRGVGDRHRVAGGEGAVAVTDHVERGLGGLELGVGGQGAAGRGLLGLPVALGGH